MTIDDRFDRQYNEVVLEEAREAQKIEGKYPFHGSEWRKHFMSKMNVHDAFGDLLRSTFLSGGALYMSHSVCKESLVHKVHDIDNGCILTDAEVAHNCEGVRLFFELDYRTSKTPLPTWEEALLHLRVLYRTVQECFPHLDQIEMYIATCTRKRKQRRTTPSIELAWGVHVVFPEIVVTTPIMKLIAQLLDTRISNLFPIWNNIVDPASYRSSNATLRPCYSYKMVDCPICTVGTKAAPTAGKRRRQSDVDSIFRMELSESCSCFSGRIVDPSIYTYKGTLSAADGAFVFMELSTFMVLDKMRITPTSMGAFTHGFCRPCDMGDEHDGIPQSDALFTAERRIVNGFQRRKNTVPVDLTRFPSGYQALLQIIHNIHESYQYLAIHKLSVDEKKRTFLITVKGSGSRYCMYRNGFHSSNRVYFCLDLKRGRIHAHCFDPDCKRAHVNTPVIRSLSRADTYRINTGFGIVTTIERPTISPIVALEAQPTPLDVQPTKKSIWEEKQRAYKLLLSTQ
jgi:hypothetical protein